MEEGSPGGIPASGHSRPGAVPKGKGAKKPGRNYDPQGGRVHNLSTKINLYEAEALSALKKQMERKAGKKLNDSQFQRLRLLNGGEPITVNYPPPPVDNRRARRGTAPPRRRNGTKGKATTQPDTDRRE